MVPNKLLRTRLTRFQESLESIQQAIEVDDQNTDFFLFEGRVLKHMGSLKAAYDVVDKARSMELTDRYVNNKAAKYAFRAGLPDTALALTHLFTRGVDVKSLPDPATLHDLQCMWFELEGARCAEQSGNVVFALKQYHWVETHFNQVQEDEFDFHEYSLRRFCLNSYINFVRMESQLRSAHPFRQAATGGIKCWLRVFDFDDGLQALREYEKVQKQAKKEQEAAVDESRFAGMTPAEKKRAKQKLAQVQKEQERQEMAKKLEEAKKLTESAGDGEEEGETTEDPNNPSTEEKKEINEFTPRRKDIVPDSDSLGFKRFQKLSKDPLQAAQVLLGQLLKDNKSWPQAHLSAFDVHIRKGEANEAWEHLNTAAQLCSGEWFTPGVIERLLPFARAYAVGSLPSSSSWLPRVKGNAFKLQLNDKAKASIDQALASLSQPLMECAVARLGSDNQELRMACAQGLLWSETNQEEAVNALVSILKPFKLCVATHEILKASKLHEAVQRHKDAAKASWPASTMFE